MGFKPLFMGNILFLSIDPNRPIYRKTLRTTDGSIEYTLFYGARRSITLCAHVYFFWRLYGPSIVNCLVLELCQKKKPFRDIKAADDVLRHFSKKELRRVKIFVFSCIVIAIHGVLYWIF